MDGKTAREAIEQLRGKTGNWRDGLHFMVTSWRSQVVEELNAEGRRGDHAGVEAIEIFLSQKLPFVDKLVGIFDVDDYGLWFYDGDGDIEDPVWRQHLVPWHCICGIVLHQTS